MQIEQNYNIRTVSFLLTENCNLNCSYCFEKHKTNKNMSFETAKKILDSEFRNNPENDFYIDFFGGEPLLRFDLVKEIYNYVINYKDRPNILFTMTTNGTLLNDEIKMWFREHAEYFSVSLSLDGDEFSQNINRCDSFKDIDYKFFYELWPSQTIKMTISKETLPYLYNNVSFLHNNGFKVNCNLAYGIDWSDTSNKSILENELNKLVEFYIANPNTPICSMLALSVENACKPDNLIRKWCGAGTHIIAYDYLGNTYPCHAFAPVSIGEDLASKVSNFQLKTDFNTSLLDEKCQNCIVATCCPTCYGTNFSQTGNLYSKANDLCELTKTIFLAASSLKYRLYRNNLLNLDEDDEYYLLRGIKMIQETF